MRIGITCYPTFGGSGVVATAKAVIGVSDGVTDVARWVRDDTASNFETKKQIEVSPYFVDPKRFRRDRTAFCQLFGSPSDKLLCHVSNFRPVKRVMDVLA